MIVTEGLPMSEPREKKRGNTHPIHCVSVPLESSLVDVDNQYFRTAIKSPTVLRLTCHGPLVDKTAWCVELHYQDKQSLRHAISRFHNVPSSLRSSKTNEKPIRADEWDMEPGVAAFRQAVSLDRVQNSHGAKADELICEYWDKMCEAGINAFGADAMVRKHMSTPQIHARTHSLSLSLSLTHT